MHESTALPGSLGMSCKVKSCGETVIEPLALARCVPEQVLNLDSYETGHELTARMPSRSDLT